MSESLIGRLRQTLAWLEARDPTSYSIQELQTLRQHLTSTIKILHDLYPDRFTSEAQQEFITILLPLERHFLAVASVSPVAVPLFTWQTVHQSLETAIKRTLSLLS